MKTFDRPVHPWRERCGAAAAVVVGIAVSVALVRGLLAVFSLNSLFQVRDWPSMNPPPAPSAAAAPK